MTHTPTTHAAELEKVRDALEAAQNGLKWYQAEHPEDASDADGEMDEQISEALSILTAIIEKKGA